MKTRWWGAGLLAVGLVLAQGMALAAESDQPKVETRVELRAQREGEPPQVRIWVNGKEVEPGEAVNLGDAIQIKPGAVIVQRKDRPADAEEGGRAWLGVAIEALSDEAARDLKVERGVVVMEVLPGSAAEKAGLRPRDVIDRVDGQPVDGPQDFMGRIQDRRPGDRVRLRWFRDGRRMEETVVLGRAEGGGPPPERPEPRRREEDRRREEQAKPEPRDEAFLGVMVAPLTDEVAEMAGTDSGVLIKSLTDDSPAAGAGLRPGDVITHINDKPVTSPDQVVDLIRGRKPGQRVHVVYYRMGKRRETEVELGGRPAGKPEAAPSLVVPEFRDMPQLREYLDQIRPHLPETIPPFIVPELRDNPQLREYLDQIKPYLKDLEQQLRKEFGPGVRVAPPEKSPETPKREPYDVGKDMGRLIERLDRIERRLDEMEKRLNQRER